MNQPLQPLYRMALNQLLIPDWTLSVINVLPCTANSVLKDGPRSAGQDVLPKAHPYQLCVYTWNASLACSSPLLDQDAWVTLSPYFYS